MQIRLVIGEQDKRYLDNFVRYLEKNYLDKIEILSFSEPDFLREYFQSGSADVTLLDEAFGIMAEEAQKYGKIAYLSDAADGEKPDGIRRIVKFKKPDLIYKDILDLYAEGGYRTTYSSGTGKQAKMTLVTSFSGGTGTSSFAAALSRQYARRGRKVLYLNLEALGNSEDFFQGSGAYTFEEVLFALKSQKTDLGLKLESAVRTDPGGVSYFAPCSSALYMMEMTNENIQTLLETLKKSGTYEDVVVDLNFRLDKAFVSMMELADQIILVQDGGQSSNSKFYRAVEALKIIEQQEHAELLGKMKLVYNRFSSSKSSIELTGVIFPVVGKIPPVKHASLQEIIDFMQTKQELFERL